MRDTISDIILHASIMGDGCVSKQKSGWRYRYQYMEFHAIKQKDYLLWKNRYFRFNYHEYIKHNKGGSFPQSLINKNNNDLFGRLYRLFYPNNKKTLTKYNIEFLKHPLGLLVLFLDDGCLYTCGCNIALLDHTKAEIQLLCDLIKDIYNVYCIDDTPYQSCSMAKKHNYEDRGYIIKFSVSNMKKLHNEILIPAFEEYGLPQCMEYKLYDSDHYKKIVEKAREYQRDCYHRKKEINKILKWL